MGKFPKMPQSCYKYWQIPWPLLKSHLSPSLGIATHVSVLQFGKFLLFPLNFGSLAVKTMAFFEISSFFIIKSSVNHTSYKYHVLYMVKHKYFHYSPISWLIGNKSSGNCQNFVICILCIVSMYSHIQIVHMVWLIGIKTMAIPSFSPTLYIAPCVTYIQIQNLYYFPIGLAHWL